MDFLAGRSRAQLAGQPIHDFRGVLDWPIRGELAERFGERQDPRYGTRVPHNGISLRTVAGLPVRVVYPGKVVIYPQIKPMPVTAVPDLKEKLPTVYAKLENGRGWTTEAENEFLSLMLK